MKAVRAPQRNRLVVTLRAPNGRTYNYFLRPGATEKKAIEISKKSRLRLIEVAAVKGSAKIGKNKEPR